MSARNPLPERYDGHPGEIEPTAFPEELLSFPSDPESEILSGVAEEESVWETEPESEAECLLAACDEPVMEVFEEPVPHFEEGLAVWGAWWHVHVYGIGCLFAVGFLFVCVDLVLLLRSKKVTHKAHFVTLHLLMLILSFTRCLYMFIDAYGMKRTLPLWLSALIRGLALPSMTASFFLIFQVYIRITRFRLARRVQKVSTLCIVVVGHFLFSLITEVSAALTMRGRLLQTVCLAGFVLICYVLSVMSFFIFIRLFNATVISRKRISAMTHTPRYKYTGSISKGNNKNVFRSQTNPQAPVTSPKPRVVFGARLVLASAVILILLATLYLANLIAVLLYDKFTDHPTIEPWPWWAIELSIRLCEVGLLWTIALAANQPIVRQFKKSQREHTLNAQSSSISRSNV